MTRFLHVANGDSTTATIAAAGIQGARSIWADPLCEGPVPGGVSDDELLDIRAGFLSGPEHSQSEVASALRQWRAVIAQGAYDELVLWFEHDLFDQLNLIQLLGWICGGAGVAKPVSLICIGSFPGRPHFKGLGELTPEELAPLFDTRQPVTPAQYALAARAWEAYRAATPDELVALLESDTSALPFLAPALRRFLAEYPWTRDGLSAFERHLLELVAVGPIALASAFPRMQDGEHAHYMTDGALQDLATGLASATPALVTIDWDTTAEREGLLQGTVTLTGEGRDVLERRRDRIELCGIDKWLGGVHLTTNGDLWRWDAKGGRIVSASATPPGTSRTRA